MWEGKEYYAFFHLGAKSYCCTILANELIFKGFVCIIICRTGNELLPVRAYYIHPDYHVSNITINTSVSSVTVFEVLTYVIFQNISPDARLQVSCQLKV